MNAHSLRFGAKIVSCDNSTFATMKQIGHEESLTSVRYQILATVVANICCLGHGCAVGWSSPTLPLLRSADSPPLQSGPVSVEMAAWIGAVMSLGGIVGTLLYGILSSYIGSKRSMLLCALPLAINWIIVYYAENAWALIVARSLLGLAAGGMFICIPLFVAEIAHERVRGQLSSLLLLSLNLGIVLGYAIASSLDYRTVPLVLVVLPVLFVVGFVWLPNTPQYLLKCGQPNAAEKSLRFYRNIHQDSTGKVQLQLKDELAKFVQIAEQNEQMPPAQISDFFTREAIRGMLIGPTLMAVAQFSGTFTLSNYANTIFSASGTSLDPNVSSMIMGGIQVLGTMCASFLIDRLGRKMLLLISCAGSACALSATGAYSYASTHGYAVADWNALPVVSLSFFIFVSSVGLTPVPYVLVSEVLPPKIRRLGATLCVCTVSVYSFVMLRYFPVMLNEFQLYGCMWMAACVSSAGFVFTLLVVEETKGRNLDQLQTTTVETP